MPTHELFLSKVFGDRYIITKFQPVKRRIKGTRQYDVDCPFDPMIFRHICEASVIKLAGSPLGHLETRRIRMTVEYIPEKGT